jgi:hypothetical protein
MPDQAITVSVGVGGPVSLDAPGNVQIDSLTGTMTWSSILGATGYRVYRRPMGQATGTPAAVSGTITGTTFDVGANLDGEPFGTYYFTVRAVGNGTTILDSEHSANGSFALTAITVTFAVGEGEGTISATIIGGATIQSGAQVPSGSNIRFTAAPTGESSVHQWLINGTPDFSIGQATSFDRTNLRSNITVRVDFATSPLPGLISTAEARLATPANYTASSVRFLQLMLAEAKEVEGSSDAAAIALAVSNLARAIEVLARVGGGGGESPPATAAEIAGLNTVRTTAQGLSEELLVTPSGAFVNAMFNAATIAVGTSGVTQQQIQIAQRNLEAALAGIATLPDVVRGSLTQARDDFDARSSADYTPESWSMAQLMYDISQMVYDNPASDQGQINAAATSLRTALNRLVQR